MRAGKILVALVLVALVLGIGGGVIWWFSVPHTAEEQFAVAEKLEKKLRGDAAMGKAPKELAADIDKTIAEYRKVGSKFGKGPKGAEALKRAAKIQEEVARDDAQAMALWDDVIKEYPEVENAGEGLLEQARLLRKAANDLKSGQGAQAADKYKEALAKLEEYRTRFEKEAGAKLDSALMEIGRIWQDGLEEPLIRAIETFEKVIKDYPASEEKPEAMFRLAQLYEKAKEFERALTLYGQLLDEYPKSPWADKAMFARGRILADKMQKHEEAAKEFERLQREHPESELSGQAQGRARESQGKAGSEEGQKYSEGRYGGTVPYDTMRDKPMPPAGMFREFAKQKLDAKKYDLNVDFIPSENRITVEGTLQLANGGEAKTELLLQLGSTLEISTLTVDGKPAKFTHQGETLKITLAEELKEAGEATVGFTYTGQYASPEKITALMTPREKTPTTDPAPTTAPATAPAEEKTATAPTTREKRVAMNPQIALGEFGYALSGAAWYPVTIIGDVFDARMVLNTPENTEAVGNGEAVKREKSTRAGVKGRFEFDTKQPVFGLYFAYGPYVVQETTVGGIHYYSYFREANASKHDAYIKVSDRILGFYASKFAPFPYEKMAMVEVPLPPFLGGVGPASLMFLHERMVAHKDVPENLLAHELAHQWFGNMVPINMMDEKYNQWLSEGFATYSDALFTEHTDGPKALSAHMQKYGQLFFQFYMLAPRGQGSIRSTFPSSGLYRPVIYEKGAIVLHMLRKVMGDAKFFQLMRDYVEQYKHKPTTMDDFRRLAGAVHGEDLSWFFGQWIDQTVFARWKVNVEVPEKEEAGGGYKVRIMIEQPDDLVKMPADITLHGGTGEKKVIANVMLDKKEQVVEEVVPFRPTRVVVDEDFWVLRHPGSDNIWPKEPEKAAAKP